MIQALLAVTAFFVFFSQALAETEVKFTNQELDAAFVLLRPELNTIELDGNAGVYTPAPALRYMGIDSVHFEVNLSGLAGLADVHFNHLKSEAPRVSIQNGYFLLNVPLNDGDHAIQSRLGSISLKGVSLTAKLVWTQAGSQELALESTELNGTLRGSGMLRFGWVLSQVREKMLGAMRSELSRLLGKHEVQELIQKGLVSWSRFTSGEEYQSVIPGSVSFYTGFGSSGIKYRVRE